MILAFPAQNGKLQLHEASLVHGLLNLVEQSIKNYTLSGSQKKAGKIREIKCSYGLLACFEENTLQACFEIFSEDTIAAGAKLSLELEPLDCVCKSCARRFTLFERDFKCPHCGSAEINFKGGNGLILQAIEVEEE